MDLAALEGWLDQQQVGDGALSEVVRLTGGTQNLLLAFRRSGRRYVLRRPPVHKRSSSDETMRREARVLAALADSDVPHARLVAACADLEPLGAAFYVTEHVDGFSPWDGLPPLHRDHLGLQHRTGLAVAGAFAALARVDVDTAGLQDLGRSQGWLERQADRWRRQLQGYAEVDGLGEQRLPGAVDVHAWLTTHRPSGSTPGLLHGDAHLGNVLVRRDGPDVAALLDWELSTLGDPLLDLGQLVATWPAPGHVYAERVEAPGLPTVAEVVQRWSQQSGRSVDDLPWFHVLACYRLAVLLEGTQARARAGRAPVDTGVLLHARAVALVAQAEEAART